ncbi:MAG: L-isoaspartyl protein carboxyl methyltransferase, partial [Patescibacteria group bacterium]|nr:L-isoaspartyl protein carboxyl methyltransferase [Patescibacteria group bacterium]
MNTQKKLVHHLVTSGALNSEHIITAFEQIDRRDFVCEAYDGDIYGDYPLLIGNDQTISQPSTVAFMMELLQPQVGENILDVGTGSGWTTAILASIVGGGGNVCGVEIVPELMQFGLRNLEKYNFAHASIELAGEIYGLP